MRTSIAIPVWVLVCFVVGLTASYFQREALALWYPILEKSSLTPPNIVFPIVWSILYLLMGISVGLVIGSGHPHRRAVMWIFIVQLVLNFMWSILFFYMCNPLWGLIDIVLLDVVVLLYMARSYSVHRAASYLFVPYVLWLVIATYLNGYILMNN